MGAMLHDYYLYDARNCELTNYQHCVSHPKTAVKNCVEMLCPEREDKRISFEAICDAFC